MAESSFDIQAQGWGELLTTIRTIQRESTAATTAIVQGFERANQAAEGLVAEVKKLPAAQEQARAAAREEEELVKAASSEFRKAQQQKVAAAKQAAREREKAEKDAERAISAAHAEALKENQQRDRAAQKAQADTDRQAQREVNAAHAEAIREDLSREKAAQKAKSDAAKQASREMSAAHAEALEENRRRDREALQQQKAAQKELNAAHAEALKENLARDISSKGFDKLAQERAASFGEGDLKRAAAGGLTPQAQALKDLQDEARKAGIHIQAAESELEKLLKKGLQAEALSSIFGKISSSLGSVEGSTEQAAGEWAGYIGTLIQGAGQAGLAGTALAALSIGVDLVTQGLKEQEEQAAETQRALVENNTRATDYYKQLAEQIRQLRVQEAALALQRKGNVSDGVAQATAEAESLNKQAGALKSKAFSQRQEIEALQKQIDEKTGQLNALDNQFDDSGSGGIRERRLKSELELLNQRKEALEKTNDEAYRETGIAQEQARLAGQQKDLTVNTELEAGLRSQKAALQEARNAAVAYDLQLNTGVSSSVAAAQATIAYLEAGKNLPPELQNAEVRAAALKVEYQKLANVTKGELVTATLANRQASVAAAVAAEAYRLQLEQGVPAALAAAQAELAYYQANKLNAEAFGQFRTEEQQAQEERRRQLALDTAVSQYQSQAKQQAIEQAKQLNEAERAYRLTQEQGIPSSIAQARVALEAAEAEKQAVEVAITAGNANAGLEAVYLKLANARSALTQAELEDGDSRKAAAMGRYYEQTAGAKELLEQEQVLARMAATGRTEEEARRDIAIQVAQAELDEATAIATRLSVQGKAQEADIAMIAMQEKQLQLANLKKQAQNAEFSAQVQELERKRQELKEQEQRAVASRASAAHNVGDVFGGTLGGLAEQMGLLEKGADGVQRIRSGNEAAAASFYTLATAAQAASGFVVEAISQQLAAFATYSKAQEQIAALQGLTAEETEAAEAAKTQAMLASISQTAVGMAAEQAAMAIAAAASYRYDAAVLHGAAAAAFAAIAGGSAAAGNAIGHSRGNTREENDALKSARKGSSRGANGDGGGGGPNVYNIYTGQGVFTTQAELERGIAKAERAYQRRK